MIDKRRAKIYCCEDISLIENYDKAVNDSITWDCHHIWETMLGYSKQELIDIDEYYGIPAINLIFLEHSEHMKIHQTGRTLSKDIRNKISKKNKGRKISEETRCKLSESLSGEKHPMWGKKFTEERKNKISESLKGKYIGEKNHRYGKNHTEETKRKIGDSNRNNEKTSKKVLQYTLNNEFVAEFPSAKEVQRQLGFAQSNVSACCRGEYKQSYGFIWKYKH